MTSLLDLQLATALMLGGMVFFAFRRATESLRQERLSRDWQEVEPDRAAFVPDDLPFEPADLQTES